MGNKLLKIGTGVCVVWGIFELGSMFGVGKGIGFAEFFREKYPELELFEALETVSKDKDVNPISRFYLSTVNNFGKYCRDRR